MSEKQRPLAYPVADAAAEIGSNRTAMYQAARAGKLKILKVGRRSVVTDEELRRFVSSLPAYTPRAA